jgi:hypothetical protein
MPKRVPVTVCAVVDEQTANLFNELLGNTLCWTHQKSEKKMRQEVAADKTWDPPLASAEMKANSKGNSMNDTRDFPRRLYSDAIDATTII